ncbi:MAG: flagellar hook-basal body complex protein [Ignavibacteriaceae bacterium]|nr:flagellar hook-basal body complex protein [Ignavibacteriaceae bacterium]
MALSNSLFSGVSGLQNLQTMMDVIGDNISNVDTIGYKSSRVTFSDTFNNLIRSGTNATSTTGGTNSFQIGLGMKVNSIDRDWSQGTTETTNSSTDLALKGNGMFILKSNGSTYYSRAGAFTFDSDGKLVDSSGAVVQGKVANGAGEISTGIQDIKIDKSLKLPAIKSTSVSWSGNLQSSSPTIRTSISALTGNLKKEVPTSAQTYPTTAYDATDTANTNKTYNEDTISGKDGTKYTLRTWYTEDTTGAWTANYAVYDSTNATQVTLDAADTGTQALTFDSSDKCSTNSLTVKDASGNVNFDLNFASLTNLDASSSTATTINKGETESSITAAETIYDSLGNAHTLTLTFDHLDDGTWTWAATIPKADGTLDSPSSGKINFNSSGSILSIYQGTNQISTTPPEPTITFTPSNGSESQQMKLDFGSGTSGITQTSLTSQVAATSQNGSAAATLSNINIDQYGNIVGVFSNGNSSTLAQLMVATFTNTNGLTSVGNNLYSVAANSGEPVVAAPGETSGTTVQSDALEQSNVDLSSEFTKMIVAQRGFEANSKVITTADSMMQVITNLIR